MPKSNAVITAYCGEHGKQLQPLSLPGIRRYAEKCQADCVVFERPVFTGMLDKMEFTRDALSRYERVLWLDGDTLVRNDMPNLFSIVPSTHFASVNHCSYSNDDGLYVMHQDIVRWCNHQRHPVPDMRNTIFCMGIYLVNKKHSFLFDPFEYHDEHPWVEQSGINVRLAWSREVPTRVLPWCFSHFVYWPYAICRRIDESNYALHYAGPVSPEQRLADMTYQLKVWTEDGFA